MRTDTLLGLRNSSFYIVNKLDLALSNKFNYDRNTGTFTYKRNSKSTKVGALAGNRNKKGKIKYLYIFDSYINQANIVWYIENKKFPNYILEHIDGDLDNFKIDNLRETNKPINLKTRKTFKKVTTP